MKGLVFRIFLYMVSGVAMAVAAAVPGITFDPATTELTLNLEEVSGWMRIALSAATGGPIAALTFWASRVVKNRGGLT